MRVYIDLISGDELGCDGFRVVEETEGVLKLQGKDVQTNTYTGIQVGTAAGDDEEGEGGPETAIDLVLTHRLRPADLDKKGYTSHIKDYLKTVKAKLSESAPDQVAEFEQQATNLVKQVLADFDYYTFYTGESSNPEGMVVLVTTPAGSPGPVLTYFKHGLRTKRL